MIILIGGASHTGKTLISQKLIEKYHFACTSMDHLKMGFIRTGLTKLTVEDDVKMKPFLWSFAAEMIKTAIENNQNFILEGCYIPKHWKQSFTSEYQKNIHAVFIVMSENYLRNHFENISKYASVIESRVDDKVNLESLICCNKEFREDCLENETPIIEIKEEYNLDEIVRRIELLCQ